MDHGLAASTRRSVALIEFVLYDNTLPLVSGYLEAYARADPDVDSACRFEKLVYRASCDAKAVADSLVAKRADVYAFSVYMWNSRTATSVARAVAAGLPRSWVILGGPQVMNYGGRYLSPELPNMVVCNSAGEGMFREFLREVVLGAGEPASVPGLSCHSGGTLISTGPAEAIADVNVIPSPFLTGLFDGFRFTTAIVETNRGCPFTCSYCFFSKQYDRKIYKFDSERVKEEIRWLARRSLFYLFFADANFGLFERDLEIVDEVVKLREETGRPQIVNFSAAKDKPDRVSAISVRLHRAGVVVSQPVSFQSLKPEALAAIRRSNIKPEKYALLQADLERKGVPTMVELIWPLPGETLESFKKGLDEFCRGRADAISVYPLVLLNNTSMSAERDAFGAVTVDVPSDTAEAELVVGTDRVSRDEHERGLYLIYGMYVLHNARALARVAAYLAQTKGTNPTELFEAWIDFCRKEPESDFARHVAEDLSNLNYYYSFKALGSMAYTLLHVRREAFIDLLHRFAKSQPWWSDERARLCFELDLIALPYVYSTTPMTPASHLAERCQALRVLGAETRSYLVEVPDSARPTLPELDHGEAGQGASVWVVDHKREQLPCAAGKSPEHHAEYCYGMLKRSRAVRPSYRRAETVMA